MNAWAIDALCCAPRGTLCESSSGIALGELGEESHDKDLLVKCSSFLLLLPPHASYSKISGVRVQEQLLVGPAI